MTSLSGIPQPPPPAGTARNPPRRLLVMMLVNLVQVLVLAAVTALYVVFRWTIFFDAIVAVAILMVGVTLAMTVWMLRVGAR